VQVKRSVGVTSNRNLKICVISLAFAVIMYSWIILHGQLVANEKDQKQDSKLDLIMSKVDKVTSNVTVLQNPANVTIVVPTDEFEMGNISGLDKSFIIR